MSTEAACEIALILKITWLYLVSNLKGRLKSPFRGY